MKKRRSLAAILGVLSLAPLAAGARAASDDTTTRPVESRTEQQMALYGYVVAGPGERTIRITNATKYINVTRLETVRLEKDGKVVVWNFDTLGTRAFPLSKILPSAVGIIVYVDESPLYRGG